MRIPVTVTGEAGTLNATIVGEYKRETIERRTEAPTVRNMAHAAFDTNPAISRVIIILTSRQIPMMLLEVAHLWFDVTAQPVQIKRIP